MTRLSEQREMLCKGEAWRERKIANQQQKPKVSLSFVPFLTIFPEFFLTSVFSIKPNIFTSKPYTTPAYCFILSFIKLEIMTLAKNDRVRDNRI